MKINEIFYSLQGEGHYTGTAAVFIRFSGCNLRCDFCDTDHSNFEEMSEEQIVEAVCAYPASHVVITGGEPSLQLTGSLVDRLHTAGKYVQVETNGTHPLPSTVDWVTCSPKDGPSVCLTHIDELKVVFQGQDMSPYDNMEAGEYRLQPCDRNNAEFNSANTAECISYIKTNPKWKLSLQTHKTLNIR